MIVISYWAGTVRRGMLAWRESPGEGPQALGGFDPGAAPAGAELLTVVGTDGGERTLIGWPHPDDVREVSGADGEAVVERCACGRGPADHRYSAGYSRRDNGPVSRLECAACFEERRQDAAP